MVELSLRKRDRILGELYLPGSKSISNRVLLLASLADGEMVINNLLDSDDVNRMFEALKTMGIKIRKEGDNSCVIKGGSAPLPSGNFELYLENAGTAMRSLTAILCVSKGKYKLVGNERMNNRPIADLVNALKQLGANISYVGENSNCPPLLIENYHGLKGGMTSVNGSISSQYLSALLMMSPYADNDVSILIKGILTSKPYVDMTMALMEKFGVNVINKSYKEFFIRAGQVYKNPKEFFIESDASSASYFLAAAAIKGEMKIYGYGIDSIQGEAQFANILSAMGAEVLWTDKFVKVKSTGTLNALDIDMNSMTDTGITLAVLSLFAKGTMKIRNIANWQVKESPRITAVATELRKCGAKVEEGEDAIFITPPKEFDKNKDITIETYDDHRIAMAFSLLSLEFSNVKILNSQCTKKTLPNFFELFEKASLFF